MAGTGARLTRAGVPGVVEGLTRAQEEQHRALSTLTELGESFEGWWKAVLAIGFASDPWRRQPSPDGSEWWPDMPGLAVDGRLDMAAQRIGFGRRATGQRVELVIRAGPDAPTAHVIGLFWWQGLGSAFEQSERLEARARALRPAVTWTSVASAWVMVLASHTDAARLRELTGAGHVAELPLVTGRPCAFAAIDLAG